MRVPCACRALALRFSCMSRARTAPFILLYPPAARLGRRERCAGFIASDGLELSTPALERSNEQALEQEPLSVVRTERYLVLVSAQTLAIDCPTLWHALPPRSVRDKCPPNAPGTGFDTVFLGFCRFFFLADARVNRLSIKPAPHAGARARVAGPFIGATTVVHES